MNERINDILSGIDTGLAAVAVDPSVDAAMSIETDVWADLAASVDQGWRTQLEADEAFAAWRGKYRDVGSSAVKSQVVSIHPQQIADNKRRMRRD